MHRIHYPEKNQTKEIKKNDRRLSDNSKLAITNP
jgi:hypothetical protein